MKNELGISFGKEKIYRVGVPRWCVLDLHGDVLADEWCGYGRERRRASDLFHES